MRLGLGLGFNKRGGLWLPGGAAAPSTPLTIISSTTVTWWVRPNIDVTDSGSGTASALNDQTTNNRDWLQAGASSIQPTINTDGPNGLKYITFDGVDDYMTNAWASPGTGFVWLVLRRNTGAGCFINGSSTSTKRFTIWENAAGTAQMNNSTAGNIANMAVGTWFRVWASFTNSVADELRVGTPAATTGTSAAGLAGVGGSWLGCGGALTLFAGFDLIEAMHCAVKPNAGEMTALDAMVTAYSAGGVQV